MIGTSVRLHIYLHDSKDNAPPEELLIDFRELIGEHSGENMAHAVYETIKKYNLQGKVSHSCLVDVIYLGDELLRSKPSIATMLQIMIR